MNSSKLQDRADIVIYIYQSELFKRVLNSDIAFEEGEFSNIQIKKIETISKHYNKFRSLITKNLAEGWTWERINPLERAILIYGSFELVHLDKALVINEMVRLAQMYIPDQSYKYINSILDKVGDHFENIKKK